MTKKEERNTNNNSNLIFNEYMGSKYSEFLFPEGIVNDKNLQNDNLTININNSNYERNKEDFLKMYSDVANKFIRPIDNKNGKMENKHSLRLDQYFSKANLIRKKRNLTNLTPDEIETFRLVKKVRICSL